jgi:PAS domain S-box-containing protein
MGVTVERLVGSPLLDFFSPEVAERRRSYLNAILDSHQPVHFTDERDGRTFENHVYPVLDTDGRVITLAAFGQDISERMRAEEMLRASEEKYRMLFQNMAEGFALYELLYDEQGEPADWRVLEVNAAYTRHTGIARDDVVGRRIGELFPAALREYLPRFAEVVTSQTPCEFETYASAVERYQRVITFPAGGPRFASTIEDITKRKQSETELHRAQAELALDVQRRGLLEERQRLARELHDSVAQTLYGISLGVNTALMLYDTDRTKAIEALNYALSLAHSGLKEMRALIFELRPESLEVEGLVVALRKQVDALSARHDIIVEPDLCGEPDIPLATKEALFRIAQEAMRNAVKHARSQRLDVRLTCEPESLCLEVHDNGMGFDPLAAYPGHLGLRSMRERVQSVDGTLDIVSAPGCGTLIRARIPSAAPESASSAYPERGAAAHA